MTYTIKCKHEGCRRDGGITIDTVLPDNQELIFWCKFCGHKHWAMQSKCNNCSRQCLWSSNCKPKPVEESACASCGLQRNLYFPSSIVKTKKQKKLSGWHVLQTMFSKKYPYYAWDCTAVCEKCSINSVWWKFDEKGMVKYCAMCGEF